MKLRCNDGIVRAFTLPWTNNLNQEQEAQCLECGKYFGIHDTEILKPLFKEHTCNSKIKLPKQIKKSARLVSKYNEIVLENLNLIRDWLTENNLANDMNIDQLIDCLETNNDAEGFIAFMESENVKIGNSKDYE
uniref:Uncharacterized protein n=1 Tax=Clostridium botulinum TaxID=1491 RepID=A0A077K7N8_CLOBO|nr:hypothetical protein [Clostridium botulinum]